MSSLLPLSRHPLPHDRLLKSGLEQLHPPSDAAWEDRRTSARSATSWFTNGPLFADGTDVDDDDEDSWCCCEPLNSTERILGWLTCFLGGLILSAVSMGAFNDMLLGKNNKFAVTYTIGNIIGLAGTSFLVGPIQQFRNMADKSRLVTSCIFVGSLVATLLSSVYLKVGLVIVFFVCIQWLAYMWYSLSYIPYGQRAVLWIFRRLSLR
ncbi:hypothetical protein, conserved [Eimeria tenella]|uniref:Vesicle transport protein n=1 Tax=Eimeria tenella TaxID=5802 RepID=H9B9K1_EIMTE|nr:hypothetical protein, conserved [Eimeria tenella]AET50661.1 hypothetical protein [Eimeria tenella]CDJ42351.1 hypothetical protein, conserved [Eimeria tenella]|eukprot:XP_013233101.1 hypothetical protein, conserved [Eimeria tenella]